MSSIRQRSFRSKARPPETNTVLDAPISLNVTPAEAWEFLDRLSNDDGFRARLKKNPTGVLKEYHIEIPIDELPGFVIVPSKETLRRALRRFSQRGEIDVAGLFSPSGWPFMLFWWLYMTPAKPPRGQKGDAPHVTSKI